MFRLASMIWDYGYFALADYDAAKQASFLFGGSETTLPMVRALNVYGAPVDFRAPEFNHRSVSPVIDKFHFDGSDGKGVCPDPEWPYIAIWATESPSEIQYHGGVFRPDPCHLIVIDNQRARHRRPPNHSKDRFFARVAISRQTGWQPDDFYLVRG